MSLLASIRSALHGSGKSKRSSRLNLSLATRKRQNIVAPHTQSRSISSLVIWTTCMRLFERPQIHAADKPTHVFSAFRGFLDSDSSRQSLPRFAKFTPIARIAYSFEVALGSKKNGPPIS